MENSWSLIQQGMFQEAVNMATEEHKNAGSSIALRHRATARMILRDYKGALDDYLSALNEIDIFYINNKYYKDDLLNKGDRDYIDVGVAYWLLSEYEQAKKMWIDSMTLKLRYTTNIMIPPCVVYFTGVYLSDLEVIKEAKKYIKKRSKGLILLGNYLLDECSEEDLLGEIKQDSPLKDRTLCQYEFYIAAKNLERGDKKGFIEHLSKCRDAKGKYLEFEYFLAVGELEKSIVENVLS